MHLYRRNGHCGVPCRWFSKLLWVALKVLSTHILRVETSWDFSAILRAEAVGQATFCCVTTNRQVYRLLSDRCRSWNNANQKSTGATAIWGISILWSDVYRLVQGT